jgi:putative sigma-54 modulation protein
MKFSVTFRKMDPTDAIKQYTEEKVKKIKRFFPDPINANVVLAMERYQHRADVTITLHNGLVLKGQNISDDMYSSIDLAMSKIEKQVRRYKDKIRSHKPAQGPRIPFRVDVIEEDIEAQPEPEAAPVVVPDETISDLMSKVVRSDEHTAQPMSVEEAVMQLNLMNNAFLVFTNSDNLSINVIYRRNDGNYGLIDTAQA